MPNTGKSTFFNRITGGSNAYVGNWPGMTVSLMQAQIKIDDQLAEVVDLPGIYDLNGFSDDEAVVQRFLENYNTNLAIIVLNASQIDRQVRLALQVKALGLPAVAILNMADEAEKFGVKIVADELGQRLGMPVCLISAKYGRGFARAYRVIAKTLKKESLSYQFPDLPALLEHHARISSAEMDAILAGVVMMPSQMQRNITAGLDKWLLHPVLGLPLFFIGMFIFFWTVWQVGLPSQGLMDEITGWIQTHWIQPGLQFLPQILQSFLIDGLWAGLATVASFVPLIILFFILMAILEDSGYLARSAYLMDAFMASLGLDGRSFVLQMMGFGCNVPALMGTRVMRSQALRWLTMLVIPFALCSARLQVFVFILVAVLPGSQGAIALFALYLLSFAVAIGTAALLQGAFKNEEPFVLELPPYRLPTLKHVVLRGWSEVRTFITRATGFITIGCIAVWAITHFPPGATGLDTIGGQIGQWLSPVMSPLGINAHLTLALIFGFLAKEIVVGSLAVIYGLNDVAVSQQIATSVTFIEGFSFCIFCLIYTPCLTTLVTLANESKSWKFTLFSIVFSLGLAWISSFVFYQGALLLGFQ
jgi:ferrous iron transport protein B